MPNYTINNKEQLRAIAKARIIDQSTPANIRIVAEGDSWFDYPLLDDILDHLCRMDYAVIKESKAGNTLEEIVFGCDYSIDKRTERATFHGRPAMAATLASIRKYKPRFVLFSAGGNDIMGEEIRQFLNHAATQPNALLREDSFEDALTNCLQPGIETFIRRVLETDPTVDILMDGYAVPFPTGRQFQLAGIGLSGPWLLPNFARKGITRFQDQRQILEHLVKRFNEMLASLAQKYEQFHYLDLRSMFRDPSDWRDEIHLIPKNFGKVAEVYHQKMQELSQLDQPIRVAS